MTSQKIRIGFVGAGTNTCKMHIPGFQAIKGVELVGVCNRSRGSAQQVADQFKIPLVFDRWQDLVASADINAIVIGTWPYMHCPVTLAALERNKHVLCEARMAMNAREAHLMHETALECPDLVTQVVPSPFTLGVDRTIQRLIAEDYLGEPLAIEVRASTGFMDRGSPLNWRQDHELSGMNIMTLGIWYEALMRWVGHAEHVQAQGRSFVRMRMDEKGRKRAVRIPEHLNVHAGMECGALAHFQISSVAGLQGPAQAWLYGEQGTILYREGKLFTGRPGDENLQFMEVPEDASQSWRVEEEFIDAIRGGAPVVLTTFSDGVKYMEFTEAVNRSMAGGEIINLPLENL
jgi:predicted dehydrogenase